MNKITKKPAEFHFNCNKFKHSAHQTLVHFYLFFSRIMLRYETKKLLQLNRHLLRMSSNPDILLISIQIKIRERTRE
jgi:hypothetical protein